MRTIPIESKIFLEQETTAAFALMASLEEHQATFQQLYQQSQGFTFHGMRQYRAPQPPGRHIVIVQNKLTEGWQGHRGRSRYGTAS